MGTRIGKKKLLLTDRKGKVFYDYRDIKMFFLWELELGRKSYC